MIKIFLTGLVFAATASCSSQVEGGNRAKFGSLPKKQHIWYERDNSGQEGERSTRSSEDLEVVQEDRRSVDSADKARLEEIEAENARKQSSATESQGDFSAEDGNEVSGIVFDAEESTTSNTDSEGLALKSEMTLDPYGPSMPESVVESCRKALALQSENNFDVFEFSGKVIRKTTLNINSEFAVISFDAEKRIVKADIDLRNAKGKYCIDMTASKAIRNVKITAACGARVLALKPKADRVVGYTLDICGQGAK